MAKLGRKKISHLERRTIYRKTPREIATYSFGILLDPEYKNLVDSFSLDDYMQYEKLIHQWGTPGRKRHVMLEKITGTEVSQPVLLLATIRVSDLRLHQKIVNILRYRWTEIKKQTSDAINNSPDKFWFTMASKIQRRSKEESIELYEQWTGDNGRVLLTEFLKEQYKRQQGKCAVSYEPIELKVGTRGKNPNKCSPDRKNSNQGYTPSNLWLVTTWVNTMKMDTPLITFWKRIDILTESRKLRNEVYSNKKRY
jgi:hypothetical protein